MKNGRYQLKDVPMKAVLRAVYEWWDDHPEVRSKWEWWQHPAIAHLPPELIFIWVERKGADWLDYGVSARGAWLTKSGLEALA